ncbi:hypothetical protein AAFZ21_000175 [Vibrio fluvialis]
MKVKLLTALIVLNSQFAFADDSETNAVARQIKSQIIKVLSKQNIDTKGFCDVFIEMKHNNDKQTLGQIPDVIGSHTLVRIMRHYV